MRFYSVTLIFSLIIAFLGCGTDDEMDNGESIESAKTPVVSVRKVKEETTVRNNIERIEVFFDIVADTTVKTDILVISSISASDSYDDTNGCNRRGSNPWITIPKGQKKSQTFSEKVTLNGEVSVFISKIPIVEFVGQKGKFVDQEKLEKYWGKHTLENKRIPDGFQFPYYEVGEPSELYLYQPKNAKIIRVEPPIGSRVPKEAQIKITFDTPPLCPFVLYHDIPFLPDRFTTVLSNTTFLVTLRYDSFDFRWMNPQTRNRIGDAESVSQTFSYRVE